jgi:small-conductance mechanosensitive channel
MSKRQTEYITGAPNPDIDQRRAPGIPKRTGRDFITDPPPDARRPNQKPFPAATRFDAPLLEDPRKALRQVSAPKTKAPSCGNCQGLLARITELEAQLHEKEQTSTQLSRLNSTCIAEVLQANNVKKELEKTIATLRSENAELQEKARSPPVSRQSALQQQAIEQLTAENERLKANFERIHLDFQKLKALHTRVQRDHEKILTENAELKLHQNNFAREQKAISPSGLSHLDAALKKMKEDTVRDVEGNIVEMTELIDRLMNELTRSYEDYDTLAAEYARLRR